MMEKIVCYNISDGFSWEPRDFEVDEMVSIISAYPDPGIIIMIVPYTEIPEDDPIQQNQFNRYMDQWFKTPEEWVKLRGVNYYRKIMGLPEVETHRGCGDHLFVTMRRELNNTQVETCIVCQLTTDGSLGDGVYMHFNDFRERDFSSRAHCNHQWSRQEIGARCNHCGRRKAS